MSSWIFEPDALLPVQVAHRRAVSGEERLMLAVLSDALSRYQKYAFAADGHGRRIFSEADTWIHDRDREWPFSFENICDVLKIDSGYVRWELGEWRRRELAARANDLGALQHIAAAHSLQDHEPVPSLHRRRA